MMRNTIFLGALAALCVQSAYAQQIKEVSDGGVVAGYASASGVTRLSFTGDAAASSPKADGGAGPGFALVHEPATGDLYLTLSRDPRPGERAGAVSFFVTTRAGFTYQIELAAKDTPSTQIEIRNPELQYRRAERAAAAAPLEERVVTLTRAMWNDEILADYEIERPLLRERAAGPLRLAVTAAYRGPDLSGRVFRVRNPGRGAVTVSEEMFLAPGVVAVTLKGARALSSRQEMTVLIVESAGKGAGR